MADNTIAVSGSPGVGVVGKSYSFTPTVTNGSGTQTWSVSTGTLPAGLSLNTGTGAVTGTPTEAQTQAVTLSVTDSTGTATLNASFVVSTPIDVSKSSFSKNIEAGVTVSFSPTISGGAGDQTWTVDPALPAGMNFGTADGTISGSPAAAGTINSTVTVTDDSGTSSFTIASTIAPAISLSGTAGLAIVDQPFSFVPTVTGGSSPVLAISGQLPPGVKLSSDGTTISGTPTNTGVFDFTIRATDALGGQKNLSVTVTSVYAAVITQTQIAATDVGVAFNTQLGVTGGHGSQTWAIKTGTLPPGVTLSASGLISGAPTAAGSATVDIQVTDDTGTAEQSFTLVVNALPSLPASLPAATFVVGSRSSVSPQLTGGTSPITFAITSGKLPDGLTINSATGLIDGTTTEAVAAASVTITATDALSKTASTTVSIESVLPVTINPPAAIGTGEVGVPYTLPMVSSNGYGTQMWSVANGTLPGGLAIESTTGVISGTPTAAGSFLLTVELTDSSGTSTQNITIPINAAIAVAGTFTTGVVDTAYSYVPSITGGVAPITFALAKGSALPAGLSLNSATGEISGTPTAASETTVSVVATDSYGQSSTLTGDFIVSTKISVSGAMGNAEVNVPYSFAPVVTGGAGFQSWAVTNGKLPAGLTLDSRTGIISGTPTEASAEQTLTLTATDTTGTATLNEPFEVYPQLVVDKGTVVSSVVPNSAYSFEPTITGGTGTYEYSLSANLPPGLAFDKNTGDITGIPTETGTTITTWSVTDNIGTVSIPLKIVVANEISISYPSGYGFEVGQDVNLVPTVTNGSGAAEWIVSRGVLPSGVALDADTGAITGKPTAVGTVSFTISATDTTGTATADFSGTIADALSFTLSTGVGYTGSTYSASPVLKGGKAPYVWSLSYPVGHSLQVDETSGKLYSAQLTNAGTVNGTLNVVDANNAFVSQDFQFQIIQEISLTGVPGTIQVGVPFTFQPTVVGGSGPQLWTVINGSLPAGLTLNTSTGVISGTPQIAAASTFVIQVSDLSGTTTSAYTLSATIPLSLSGSVQQYFLAGSQFTFQPTVVGGAGTVQFSSGDLPAFLTINKTTGNVTGTLPKLTTSVSFTVTAIDTLTSKSVVVSFGVAQAVAVTYPKVSMEVGIPATITPSVSNGAGAQTWKVSSGSIPAGMSLNSATGIISGTPTAPGSGSLTISVSDSVSSYLADVVASVSAALQMSITPTNGVVGSAYSASPLISGGVSPYTFSFDTPPGHGLSIDPKKGTVSSPSLTDVGTIAVNYKIVDGLGASVSVPFSMAISGPISISGTVPQGEVGFAFLYTPLVKNGSGTRQFSITNGQLPPGLSGSPTTGSISGTPKSAGTTPLTITVEDDTGSVNQDIVITINPALSVSGTIPSGVVGKPYQFAPIVTGGTANKVYAISGMLPEGLSFNSTTGVISGTPVTAMSGQSVAISITDAYSTVQVSNSISIYTPVAITGTPASVFVGDTVSFIPTTSGGSGPKSFAISSGALPAGWTFDPTTGGISGLAATANNTPITITVSDATGTANLAVTMKVVNHLQIYGTAPDALVNQSYSFAPSVSGGIGPYSFSLSGNIPAGFGFDTSTGIISGTPISESSAVKSTITVTDGHESKTLTVSIAVDRPIVVVGTPPLGVNGEAYSFTPYVSGGSGTKTLALTGNLPAGVTFDATSGLIGGTPTVDGTFDVAFTVTDDSGSLTVDYSIVIGKSLAIVGPIPAAVVGAAYSYVPNAIGGGANRSFTISGTLPTGMSFDPNLGTITGTATAVGSAVLTITVSDGQESASFQDTLIVKDPMTIVGEIPTGALNQSYSFAPTVAGGSGARSFTLKTQGDLQAGLTFNATTGVISGTPTVSGVIPISIVVTDTYTSVTLSGNLNIVNTGQIPNGNIQVNDTQILSYMAQYRAVVAKMPMSSKDYLTAIRLLNLITQTIITSPTQTVLQALWQMHIDLEYTAFDDSVVFTRLDVIPQQAAKDMTTVYSAYRSALMTPTYVRDFNTLLAVTGCFPMQQFLLKKIRR